MKQDQVVSMPDVDHKAAVYFRHQESHREPIPSLVGILLCIAERRRHLICEVRIADSPYRKRESDFGGITASVSIRVACVGAEAG